MAIHRANRPGTAAVKSEGNPNQTQEQASDPNANPNGDTASAKPGAAGPDGTGKAPKAEKTPWGDRDAEGELKVKITKQPEDYSPKKHKPLVRKDFATTADFYDWRADISERNAKQLRQMAADERSGVGKSTKAKQKKLLTFKSKFDSLLKELSAELGEEAVKAALEAASA